MLKELLPNAEELQSSRRLIKSLKAQADRKRTFPERLADFLTSRLGSMRFLLLNAGWFVLWIIINVGLVPGVSPFDPFPFGLLTMIVSLEAIILAVIVLISQNRASKVDDVREEVDLQVDIITEQELTKVLEIVSRLAKKQGIDLSKDKILHKMLRPTNTGRIQEILEKEL